MAKRKSLAHQLRWAIFSCYKPGTSQKKLKEKVKGLPKNSREYAEIKAIITSKNTKKNLLDVINQFVTFLRKSCLYGDFRYVYELDGGVWLEFLRWLRNERGYSKTSIRNYISRIQHIEWCCIATYKNAEINFEVERLRKYLERLKDDEKIRSVRLSFEEYKKVLTYLANNHSKNYQLALLLQCTFGLRSYEATRIQFRDILNWDGVIEKIKEIWKEREEKGLPKQKFYIVKSPYNVYLSVKGKGGQWRFVPAFFPYQRQLLQYILDIQKELGRNPEDWVCKCSTSTMRRELKRIITEELGFKHYKDVPSSTHMLRKTYARIHYAYINNNKDKIERVIVSPTEGIIKL